MNPATANALFQNRVWHLERKNTVDTFAAFSERCVESFRLNEGARKTIENEPSCAVRLL